MNRKSYIAIAVAFSAGCASYTQSKIDLAAQAQKAVTTVRSDIDSQRTRTLAAGDALRAQLDAAFDEDVASRGETLEPEWVIAHRKAYALALDAFEADRRAADAEGQATLRTLDSINAALGQLQQMHAAELKLTLPELKLPEVKR